MKEVRLQGLAKQPDLKSEKITKKNLDSLNQHIKDYLGFKLWVNIKEGTKWFTNIKEKPSCTLLQFDVE